MILNLTQHPASTEQRAAGVVDIPPALAPRLKALLTFEELPEAVVLTDRARSLSQLALEAGHLLGIAVDAAMVGGAGYFLPVLERQLLECNVQPLHAFTKRVAVETTGPDGTVIKVAQFRHEGFVTACRV